MTSEAMVARVEMLIRSPVNEVFEAFVDPAITSKFWFSRGSAKLEAGESVRWDWEMVRLLNRSNGQGAGAEQENSRRVVRVRRAD